MQTVGREALAQPLTLRRAEIRAGIGSPRAWGRGKPASDGDLEALVAGDTRFHDAIVRAGGSRRVRELWHGLDGQMGSLMRSSLERQRIDLAEVVVRHQALLDVIATAQVPEIVRAMRDHYLDPVEPDEDPS